MTRNSLLSRDEAIEAYWKAQSRREERLLYYTMVFFGIRDGWPPTESRWRQIAARWLRKLALWIEHR